MRTYGDNREAFAALFADEVRMMGWDRPTVETELLASAVLAAGEGDWYLFTITYQGNCLDDGSGVPPRTEVRWCSAVYRVERGRLVAEGGRSSGVVRTVWR